VPDDPLRPFLANPGAAGLFLDFDGTLSHIVHKPSEARPLDGVTDVLDRLASRYRVVAIVSGRSAAELLSWLGTGVEIWGTHGAERTEKGRVVLSERAAPFSDLMDEVKKDAVARLERLDLEGVLLEDKGVMLGLHFRAAADVEEARVQLDRLADDLAERYGLERAGGRLAYELRPPVELTKRAVVWDRSQEFGLEAACFFGDDRVDLPAFDALDALAKEGVAVLRVGVDSDEAPPELLERADVIVSGPEGALKLLRRLAG
jgi:trehalose 6-phosphate phosphatase